MAKKNKKIINNNLSIKRHGVHSRFVLDMNEFTEKYLTGSLPEKPLSKWQKIWERYRPGNGIKIHIPARPQSLRQSPSRAPKTNLARPSLAINPVGKKIEPDSFAAAIALTTLNISAEKSVDIDESRPAGANPPALDGQPGAGFRQAAPIRSPWRDLAIVNLFQLIFQAVCILFNSLYRICYHTGRIALSGLETASRGVFFFYRLLSRTALAIKPASGPRTGSDSHPDMILRISALIDKAIVRAQAGLADEEKEIYTDVYQEDAPLPDYGAFEHIEEGRGRQKRDFSWRVLVPNFHWSLLRSSLVFAAVLLLIAAPFKLADWYRSLDLEELKGRVLGMSESAVDDVKAAGRSAAQLDFTAASEKFSQASANFMNAQQELGGINDLLLSLAALAPDQDIKLAANAKKILAAGETASSLGQALSQAANALFDHKPEKDIKSMLEGFLKYSRQAAIEAHHLASQLEAIDSDALPSEYRERFDGMRSKAGFMAGSLDEIADMADKASQFLGTKEDKRYLLIFQNNAEMRGSGGFVGSYALIDMRDGKIRNMEIPGGGSYDTKAGLLEKIYTPYPLQLLGARWRFWDANWWPDWPASARKLQWFYEHSGGASVDGVIAFTPTVMEELLRVLGPIDLPDYGLTITAENFFPVVQEITEEKLTGEKTPKKIIGDLMDRIVAELPRRLNKENLTALARSAENDLKGKQILFYFNDPVLQDKIEELGWDGSMRSTGRDYLSVVNTNIGGGKSDRKIKEKIEHEAQILPDGSVIDSLSITRTHEGSKDEKYVGANNVDWMRIYVPRGSELLGSAGWNAPDPSLFKTAEESYRQDSDLAAENAAVIDAASGTRIYQENDHTVFANWSQVKPGESATVTLRYRLPFRIFPAEDQEKSIWRMIVREIMELTGYQYQDSYPYSLLVQKQPGSRPSQLVSILNIDSADNIVWRYPKELPATQLTWKVDASLEADKFWAVLVRRGDNAMTRK